MTDPSSPLRQDGAVVVVGAGLGGLRAAEALRAQGFTGSIALVGEETRPPYDRPPLTKQLLSGKWDEARVTLATDAKLREQGIDFLAGARATSLDVAGRAVTLEDGRTIGGDAVVLATGATPAWLPGTEGLAGVHVIRTMDQSLAVRRELEARGEDGRLVVVGAGFIGAEVASTAKSLGLAVTMVEVLEVPLAPVVGETVGRWVTELHRLAGVEVRTGAPIARVEGREDARPAAVVLEDATRLEADAVVLGIGVKPETRWLEGSGLEVGDGVVTDASLFAADGVVAVGDLARFTWLHALGDEQVRIEHWEVTTQLATHAATSLLAGRAEAPAVSLVPYFWSDQHGRKLQMLGRPWGTDEVTLAAGSLGDGAFTFLYHRGGRVTGVLGLAMPRHVMLCRTDVERGAPLADALARFA